MARLRRRTVATLRVPVRFVETDTRAKCRAAIETGLPEDWQNRGIIVRYAGEYWDISRTELLGYKYDVTALI